MPFFHLVLSKRRSGTHGLLPSFSQPLSGTEMSGFPLQVTQWLRGFPRCWRPTEIIRDQLNAAGAVSWAHSISLRLKGMERGEGALGAHSPDPGVCPPLCPSSVSGCHPTVGSKILPPLPCTHSPRMAPPHKHTLACKCMLTQTQRGESNSCLKYRGYHSIKLSPRKFIYLMDMGVLYAKYVCLCMSRQCP